LNHSVESPDIANKSSKDQESALEDPDGLLIGEKKRKKEKGRLIAHPRGICTQT
jgi:hypothetical protein